MVSNNYEPDDPDTAEKVDFERIKWIKGDLEAGAENFPDPNYERFSNMSPAEMFNLFFDEDVFQFLVDESNNYATYQNCANPNITIEEMRCAIAILILSGYNILPEKKYYWDTEGRAIWETKWL